MNCADTKTSPSQNLASLLTLPICRMNRPTDDPPGDPQGIAISRLPVPFASPRNADA